VGVGFSKAAKAAGKKAYKKCKEAGGTKREAGHAWIRAARIADPHFDRKSGAQARKNIRERTFAAYGGKCRACGETEACCLTIDHVFDDGAAERATGPKGGTPFYHRLSRAGFPQDRYQLLCHNCQYRKRNYGPDITSWPKHNAG
jgi:hypothetical protein